jgi:hypothetical protein
MRADDKSRMNVHIAVKIAINVCLAKIGSAHLLEEALIYSYSFSEIAIK